MTLADIFRLQVNNTAWFSVPAASTLYLLRAGSASRRIVPLKVNCMAQNSATGSPLFFEVCNGTGGTWTPITAGTNFFRHDGAHPNPITATCDENLGSGSPTINRVFGQYPILQNQGFIDLSDELSTPVPIGEYCVIRVVNPAAATAYNVRAQLVWHE